MFFIAAALAAVPATPAAAQNVVRDCYSLLGDQVYVTTDTKKLEADIACFKKAKWYIDISIANRQARLDKLTPKPVIKGKPIVVAEGDSISLFWNGSYTGIFALRHPNVDLRGAAVSGSRISDTGGGNGLVQRRATDMASNPELVTVQIGANDLGDGQYETAQDWLNALWAYVASVKATGAKVAVGTVLPLCFPSYPAYHNRHKERRPIVNAAIRQALVDKRIDGVIDFAADPVMGPDEAACDKTLFKDGIHPTDGNTDLVGGSGKMALIYERAVDKMLAAK
ncbi:SGNH/GDSL hydrolase family protein [Sphingomonas endophytica]|nr:SGNH/GDSL hydrolase family protein [Sphingomonas endophytica]